MRLVLNASLGKAEIVRLLGARTDVDVAWADDVASAARDLRDADALVCTDFFYTPELAVAVKSAPRLRWIQLLTAGYDQIKRLGARPDIAVCNAGAAYAPAVATHAVSLLLALQRCVPACLRDKDAGVWERKFAGAMTTPATSTIAIVGFGPIGREIARLLRAFGARIVSVTRSARPDPLADEAVRIGDLRALLPRVDAIILAAPLDEASRGLFGAAEFGACRKSAHLVNIARGAIVDQTALEAALRDHQIAGAAIDVTDPEPLPAGHPLWRAPNLIISPHCAGACGPVAGERLAHVVMENLDRFIGGRPLEHVLALTPGG